jgi:hypothetical protein
MTENNPDDVYELDKENESPPDSDIPGAAADKATDIINALMRAGQWQVNGSTIVPTGNSMWELRIYFKNGTTRRVRIGGDGSVTSDTTAPTSVLQ